MNKKVKKNKKKSKKNILGISLVEILIVVSVFAVLGVLVARSVIVTLRGSRKSEAQIKVRENLNYAFSIMERQLRSAQTVECPNIDPITILDYTTIEGIDSSFSCIATVDDSYIASGSARLTSEGVSIDSCQISCAKDTLNDPPQISIDISASDADTQGAESSTVTIETEIVGRNY